MAYLFYHEKFMRENQISPSSLPEELQAQLTDFDAEFGDLDLSEEDETESEFAKVLKLSKSLKSKIQQNFEDDQSEEELPEEELKEKILEFFWASGLKTIEQQQLKAKDYPVSKLTRKGEKVGKFELKRKSALDTFYTLLKTQP
jgi:hypothetical protein